MLRASELTRASTRRLREPVARRASSRAYSRPNDWRSRKPDAKSDGPLKGRLRYYQERRANAGALRAERRVRSKEDFTDAARNAESSAQTKGGFFQR